MARIRDDYVFGTLAAEIGTGDTTITSTGLERLSAVSSPDIAAVILYSGDAYEIVHVTDHTALSDTATVLRGQEGTAAQAWGTGAAWLHGLTVADVDALAAGGGGGSGSGGILAYVVDNPGTSTDYATTSTTDVDVNAATLSVTFTAPSSGKVLVRLTALGEVPEISKSAWWTIREGTTTLSRRYVTTARAATYDYPGNAAFVVTGLTSGAVHTYKWGHYTSSGGTSKVRVGGILGPAVMEVHALP